MVIRFDYPDRQNPLGQSATGRYPTSAVTGFVKEWRTTKGYKPLGYRLADNIFYCLHHREIITLRGTRTQVQLRSTMACLLEYLLAHGREQVVSDEELMVGVWEKNNLRPSTRRLWQVTQTLKSRLSQAGIESALIIRVRYAGYYINNAVIAEIYSSKPPDVMNYINISPADMNKLLVHS